MTEAKHRRPEWGLAFEDSTAPQGAAATELTDPENHDNPEITQTDMVAPDLDDRPVVPVRKEIDLEEPMIVNDNETLSAPVPLELLEQLREPPPVRPAPAPAPPPRGQSGPGRRPERDTLELGAVLGVPELPPPPPRKHEPMPEHALGAGGAGQERRLKDVLRESEETKGGKKRRRGPDEGAQVEDIQSAAIASESLAKIIPIVLAAMMAIAFIITGIKMLSSDTTVQEHIELRLIGDGRGPATAPSDKLTRISVDTRPSGLLVLYEREVLGKTPFLVDLPVKLIEPVNVEVTSPYFETWVGKLTRDPNGEYQVSADLRHRD